MNQSVSGRDFLEALTLHEKNRYCAPDKFVENQALGGSLSILYRISTCDGGCRRGDHILEALGGRSYNHGVAAINLIILGFYDEAFNLIRSIGEIANLLASLFLDPSDYPKWVMSSKSQRIKFFGPQAVRNKIEKSDIPVPMDADTYTMLCELATHPTGKIAPNCFNPKGTRNIGGVSQDKGIEDTVQQLTYILSQAAMFLAKMVGREELLNEMITLLDVDFEIKRLMDERNNHGGSCS